jgi:CubicO group peptidase (beta-lactamase class C family)
MTISFRFLILIFSICLFVSAAESQALKDSAEKIRTEYKIPELGYAVVSSDSVLEIQISGFKRINSRFKAELTDRFHLGSNTKAITSLIAALLVRHHKIYWSTKIFDLFPEWKAESNPAYFDLTLQDLLTFRANLPPYTYTNRLPKKFKGDYAEQRRQLAEWFLKQNPNETKDELKLTNAGYIIGGLMLEKASGKTYKELVEDLGAEIGINFGFDYPNLSDKSQTWGHDAKLKPLSPKKNYKLNWLLSAGNVNASLPDYAKFIQLQLRGLNRKTDLLPHKEFEFLHYGFPDFAVGWFWKINDNNQRVSYNIGNAGAFITEVYVVKDSDRAYILFANSATDKTSDGLKALLDLMIKKYGN